MGIVNSVDTRRISFDNNIISPPALIKNLPMGDTSDDDDLLLQIDPLGSDKDFNFKEDKKSSDKSDTQEGGDTEYWRERVETLKKEHQLINKIVETEFEKTVESVRKNYESPNTLTIEKIKKVKPCLDWRQKMMQCYEQNPHQPLVCSGTVQAFAECVSSCREPDI